MTRSDTYRLRRLLDSEIKKGKRWSGLYEFLWFRRVDQGFSWDAIAYLLRIETDIQVSGETLRRWCSDDKGRMIGREKFNGEIQNV